MYISGRFLISSYPAKRLRTVPCRTIRNTIIKVAIDSISIDQARLLDKHLHNWGRDWVEWGETERENGQHLLICSYKITEYRQQQQQEQQHCDTWNSHYYLHGFKVNICPQSSVQTNVLPKDIPHKMFFINF